MGVPDASREVDFARFGLNRIARGHLTEPPAHALAALAAGGRRLDALLPSLDGRAVSVVPSARTWLRAGNTHPFGTNKTVLVSVPGLGAARTEVRTLAGQYGGATVLGDGTATTARVLEAIDGAGLAHLAAHGVFRADNPLFSYLRLDDGPMTVHDVGRLRRAPFRLILPSCESARLAPAGAGDPAATAVGWSFIALGA